MATGLQKTVLVVDDDWDTLEFIAQRIAGLGPTVYTADCGDEALRLLEKKKGRVDLVLSDVIMPGMSGMELAKVLFEKAPEAKVILMSGFLQPSPGLANIATYEKGFIRKPFSGKTLADHVRKALNEPE